MHRISEVEKSYKSIDGDEHDAEDDLPERSIACICDDVPSGFLQPRPNHEVMLDKYQVGFITA